MNINSSDPLALRAIVIVPCFNEAAGLSDLLTKLIFQNNLYDILVIDDGSIDQTKQIAQKFVDCLRLVTNLGIGGAIQTGIK